MSRSQVLVKAKSAATSLRAMNKHFSYLRAGKSMQAAVMESGVTFPESTCREHVKKAFDNGCVGLYNRNAVEAKRCRRPWRRRSPTW